jgi:hypothetical protein
MNKLPQSRRVFALRLLLSAASVLIATSMFSAPADEITRAVTAGGASTVKSADAKTFTRGFSAVLIKQKEDQVAAYVTAAVKLRPDLGCQTFDAALRAVLGNKPASSQRTNNLTQIVKAAVAADPEAAACVVSAAIRFDSAAREQVVAAALAAAPDQRTAIMQAASEAKGGASMRGASFDAEGQPGGAGTMNPANLSDQGSAASPENDKVVICHNGHTITVSRQGAENHLKNHPGDYLGPCRP